MRRRLAWEGGRWNWVPKVPTGCGKVKSHELSNPVCYRNTRFPVPQPDSLDKFQEDTVEESQIPPSRSQKRAFLHCSSTTESHTAHSQNLLALETNSYKQTVLHKTLLEKVDDVSYPRETLAKKQMCAFNIRLTGYNKMDSCSFSPLNDSDSGVSCSVGSCNVTSECRADFPFHFVPGALCSDAESVCCSGDEEEIHSSPHRQEEDLAESIHRLELHAYHSTLEALYASGPLSWEQETMLTNLRITLHISNDEHLLELKNLISAKSCKYYVRQ